MPTATFSRPARGTRLLVILFALLSPAALAQTRPPNVVMILTDDQGYGDLATHGNPVLRTPSLDRLARQSVELTRFYSMPVCSPTRAGLLTGRYYYRTGVVDTYLGRSMMHNDEVTLAEMFAHHGYRTGLFGKWHLGDCYPMRPMEQGFQKVLMHRGGGMVQPGDPPGSSYTDPILQHNGRQVRAKGYCTDVFTDAAIQFIEANKDRPFLAWLATNAPHTPLQAPADLVKAYRDRGVDDQTAKIYAMCENIDTNVGRVMAKLAELNLENDTILIFMTDNGPELKRYNSNLRDLKGTAYEGGIRVPFFVRWPGKLKAGTKIDRVAAHVDLLPTLLEFCKVPATPAPKRLDGISLAPLLRGQTDSLPDRTIYAQWTRFDEPVLWKNSAAVTQKWKLFEGKELYDLETDPNETKNVAAEHPEIVARMRRDYEAWFADVTKDRRFAPPPRIVLGNAHENPVTLTRQDWRGPNAGWRPYSTGYWEVDVERGGRYDVTVRFRELKKAGEVHFALGDLRRAKAVGVGADRCVFEGVELPAGPGRLDAAVTVEGAPYGAGYVDVRRVGRRWAARFLRRVGSAHHSRNKHRGPSTKSQTSFKFK